MSEERGSLFTSLTPPARGWERLQARRAAHLPAGAPWFALAAGVAVAALALKILSGVPPVPLAMPANAARLIQEPETGHAVRVAHGEATALPSGDANVRLYWTGPVSR